MNRFAPILIAALLSAFPLHADSIPPEDLEVFFELVAVGPTSAVAATLAETPALATARDPDGFEGVHMLDYADFAAKLQLLLDNGAKVDAQNNDGIALIHILIDPEFLPAVLAAGADINLRDASGRTPLMLFAQEPEGQDMVAALLAVGADASLRDSHGQTVLYYARGRGQDDSLIQALIDAGAPTD
jgi:ankyrin repeat protein